MATYAAARAEVLRVRGLGKKIIIEMVKHPSPIAIEGGRRVPAEGDDYLLKIRDLRVSRVWKPSGENNSSANLTMSVSILDNRWHLSTANTFTHNTRAGSVSGSVNIQQTWRLYDTSAYLSPGPFIHTSASFS